MVPEITLVITTWPNHPKRWEYFMFCIPKVLQEVTASGHKINYAVLSESEHDPLHNWYGEHLKEFCQANDLPLTFRQGPPHLGKMMNAAMKASKTKYTMIVQDDWFLEHPCDLSPGIQHMEDHPEIDTIRYSWPGEARVTVCGEFHGWRKLDPAGSWPYGDDPHIKRDTFVKRFGPYLEHGQHGISEGAMGYVMRDNKALILLADRCYFGHCGLVPAVVNDLRGDFR